MATTEKKTRKKPGRPTTLTPQVEDHLLRLITEGNNVVVACEKAGIGYHAIKNREEGDPAFTQRLARASLYGAQFALARAEDRLEKANPKNISVVREIALHWRWVASKLLPVYRDRVGVDLQADLRVKTEVDLTEGARRIAFVLAKAARLVDAAQPAPLLLGVSEPVSEPKEKTVEGEVVLDLHGEPVERKTKVAPHVVEDYLGRRAEDAAYEREMRNSAPLQMRGIRGRRR